MGGVGVEWAGPVVSPSQPDRASLSLVGGHGEERDKVGEVSVVGVRNGDAPDAG